MIVFGEICQVLLGINHKACVFWCEPQMKRPPQPQLIRDLGSLRSSTTNQRPKNRKHKSQCLSVNVLKSTWDQSRSFYCLTGTDWFCTSLLGQMLDFFHWERRLVWGGKSCVWCVCAGLRRLWRPNRLRALVIRAQILQVGMISAH